MVIWSLDHLVQVKLYSPLCEVKHWKDLEVAHSLVLGFSP